MNTSSRQWSEMVIGSNALLKMKGWVPMSLKPLLVRSLKTSNYVAWLYDYKNKTQDAPY
jgi:hypothetical protein